jgi:hypothetical protein
LLFLDIYKSLESAPVFLRPDILLCIVGNVDNPTSIVFPVTPIEIGEPDRLNPDNLPQEYFPTGFDVLPVDANPTTDVVDNMLQVIIPTVPLEENAEIM